MVSLCSSCPCASRHTVLHPVRKPGSMARIRFCPRGEARSSWRRFSAKTRMASLSAFSLRRCRTRSRWRAGGGVCSRRGRLGVPVPTTRSGHLQTAVREFHRLGRRCRAAHGRATFLPLRHGRGQGCGARVPAWRFLSSRTTTRICRLLPPCFSPLWRRAWRCDGKCRAHGCGLGRFR